MRSGECRFEFNSLDQVVSCSTRLSATEMSGTLIIGYGNPLREDDGVGWQVADQLLKNSEGSIKVLTAHTLAPTDLTEDSRPRVRLIPAVSALRS